MKLKTTNEEILLGKFSNTISIIESNVNESYEDIQMGNNWEPETVNDRMERIKEAFFADLKKLANDLEQE